MNRLALQQHSRLQINHKPFGQVVWLAIFLLLSFSTLKYLPGMLIVQDVWTALIIAGVIFVYIPYVFKHGFLSIWFEGYVLLMISIAPIISAYGALNEFGQPLVYGIAANRSTFLMGSALLYTVMFRSGIVDLILTRRAITLVAVVSLVGWSLASVFIDLTAFDEPIPGLIEVGESAKLLLDPSFIVFGYFYYLFSHFFSGVKRHGWIALAMLAYLILGMGGRLCIAATILTTFLFLWKRFSVDRMLTLSVKISLTLFLFGVTLYSINPEKIESLGEKFSYAVEAVVTGAEVEDVSARARLLEKWIAEPYIEKNFWLGNGFLSNQWNDGFKGQFGYFHPSDIGLYGVLFQYGFLCALLFSFLFVWAIVFYQSRKNSNDNGDEIFLYSSFALIFYFLFYSTGTGWFAFSAEQMTIVVAFLICFGRGSSLVERSM